MSSFKGNKYQKTFSTETVHMGTFIHTAEDLIVLKLESQGIPYPNSPVIYKEKPIGKVDEVFGQFNDPYVSVKLDNGKKITDFRLEAKFEGYKEKFIPKDRFLPREEVEKRKELNDKKKDADKRGNDFKKSFNRGKLNGGDRKFKKEKFSDRKFNERKGGEGFKNKEKWSNNRNSNGNFNKKKTKFD